MQSQERVRNHLSKNSRKLTMYRKKKPAMWEKVKWQRKYQFIPIPSHSPSTISIRKSGQSANDTTNSPSWRLKMAVKGKFYSSDFICEIIVKTATPKLFKMKILAFVLQIDFYCWTLILKCIVRLPPTLLRCSKGAIQTNLRGFFLPQWM